MNFLVQSRSIRRKLNAIILIVMLSTLGTSAVALVVFDMFSFLRDTRADLATQAKVLGLNTVAALEFQDPRAATQALASLEAKPSVVSAAVYDAQRKPFAQYPRAASVPARPGTLGVHYSWRYADVVSPIMHAGEQVGFMFIRVEHQIGARLLEYCAAVAIIMLVTLGAGLLLAWRLQRSITEPLAAISDAARGVLGQGMQGIRAQKQSNDEIGELADAFNAMLEELEQRASRLETSNRAKDQFLATLAHELRNPLAPIRTGLEILKKDTSNGPISARARATMERQLTHMVHLIDDLLDISRVNTGKIKLDRSTIVLDDVLQTAVESCQPAIAAKRQELRLHASSHRVLVDADPVRLAQAVANVLTNASKFTPEGGLIELSTRLDEHEVRIRIRDNGIGIPPEAIDQVFELFAQLPGKQGVGVGGLGIGLFLVRNLVRLHGGEVYVESAGEGQGTIFTLALPIVSSSPAAEPAAAPLPEAAGAAPAGKRILVVDDNVDAAVTLVALLEMYGHRVDVVHDGTAAVGAASEIQPEFVVLDIGLPDIDGYEVARRIRSASQPRRGPVLVAATGWSSVTDRMRASEAGFDYHLAKPIDIAALNKILEGSEA
jgi:signal transduction histidine kinase/ActR/RegA family two-component response regulator